MSRLSGKTCVPVAFQLSVSPYPLLRGLERTTIGFVVGLPVIRVDLWRVISRHEAPLHPRWPAPTGQIGLEDPQRLGDVDLVDGVLPGGWRDLTIVEHTF